MKTANVISVRDIVEDNHPELNRSSRRREIEALLRRYPDIKESETAEIVHFVATGSHLDVGMIAGNDELRDKVEAVRKANPSAFRIKAHELFLFVCGVAGPAAFLLAKYLWV